MDVMEFFNALQDCLRRAEREEMFYSGVAIELQMDQRFYTSREQSFSAIWDIVEKYREAVGKITVLLGEDYSIRFQKILAVAISLGGYFQRLAQDSHDRINQFLEINIDDSRKAAHDLVDRMRLYHTAAEDVISLTRKA